MSRGSKRLRAWAARGVNHTPKRHWAKNDSRNKWREVPPKRPPIQSDGAWLKNNPGRQPKGLHPRLRETA